MVFKTAKGLGTRTVYLLDSKETLGSNIDSDTSWVSLPISLGPGLGVLPSPLNHDQVNKLLDKSPRYGAVNAKKATLLHPINILLTVRWA